MNIPYSKVCLKGEWSIYSFILLLIAGDSSDSQFTSSDGRTLTGGRSGKSNNRPSKRNSINVDLGNVRDAVTCSRIF